MDNKIKLEIIKQKLEAYKQQEYSFELDLKIAKLAEDDNLKQRVLTQLKTVLAALNLLNSKLKELETTES